ncbi:class I SAM-dependent methyltransferase [Dyella sp. EPa41]|uniref:class I SAM-dependent methyltransferase n=1 Tax=Dyella sp. EPa41 TaxID=1561194 RepID=UPI001F1EEE17|nr:class I SAM-dependent methyltransferase [Dyella sp. EPa41]
MTAASSPIDAWNGHSGCAWVDLQPVLDGMFRPLREVLVDEVRARKPHRLLDIGCGTGDTTLAAARALGKDAECTGVDISRPMMDAAIKRARRERSTARFVCDNAQTHAFEPGSIDLFISRLGVMFFEQPVAAFLNLRRAARSEATLCFIAWRSADENPYMTAAERAAAAVIDLPARQPGPGQFAFADRERTASLLSDGGWLDVDVQPLDVTCAYPESELTHYFTRLGPVGVAMQQADAATRARVVAAVRPAFDPFVDDGDVRFNAACWVIRARAS